MGVPNVRTGVVVAGQLRAIGAESFIVWHEGFDLEHQPRISMQPLDGEVDALLKVPIRRAGVRNQRDQVIQKDPWQDVFDALRLTRYFLQYGTEPNVEGHVFFPDKRRVQTLMEPSEAQKDRSLNWLRFDLALLELLMTARALPEAVGYIRALPDFLPSSLLEQSGIFVATLEQYKPTLRFLGGLVYKQRNSRGLRLRLLTQGEESLSRSGFKSVVPWTLIWSLGTGGDDCCRHEDFKNGIAVVSWRSLNPNVAYSQTHAIEFAPVAQIAQGTPYGETLQEARKVMSIPGIVRVGASLTLRFDHAYMAQFLGRNVQAFVGVVDPETLQ